MKKILTEKQLNNIICKSLKKAILNEISNIANDTNITVCSLDEFYGICEKLGINENNVDLQKQFAFIEIGSTINRWKAEVNHYNSNALNLNNVLNGNLDKTNYNDMFKYQFFFQNEHNNVLKLIYDDNQKINNKTKKIGDKNFYGVSEYENNATCVNLSAGETNNGKKTKFYYSGAKLPSINDLKSIKNFVDRQLSNNEDIKFVIHCMQGTSRSAAIGTYIARKISEIKKYNWEEYANKLYDEHKTPLINGKKHQFRIGKGSKGNNNYPHGITLQGLGDIEGWNYKGKGSPQSWAHDFIKNYGDINDKKYQ